VVCQPTLDGPAGVSNPRGWVFGTAVPQRPISWPMATAMQAARRDLVSSSPGHTRDDAGQLAPASRLHPARGPASVDCLIAQGVSRRPGSSSIPTVFRSPDRLGAHAATSRFRNARAMDTSRVPGNSLRSRHLAGGRRLTVFIMADGYTLR
jgi:hypothetical protein